MIHSYFRVLSNFVVFLRDVYGSIIIPVNRLLSEIHCIYSYSSECNPGNC